MSAFGGRLQRKLFNNLKLERTVYTFMTEEGSMSQWIQDNLRIIISIGIVILLVFAIYSYSKRNSRVNVIVDDSQIEEVAVNGETVGDDEINKIIAEINDEDTTKATSETTPSEKTGAEDAAKAQAEADRIALEKKQAEEKKIQEETARAAQIEQEKKEAQQRADEEARIALEKKQAEEKKMQEEIAATETKQPARDVVQEIIESRTEQKDGVVSTTAVRGDSATTLARKALAEYMTKNNITDLSGSHKIYIEDYLRKHQNVTRIYPGTEMQFTQAMIDEAITKSRTLTDAQIANLDKYARRVKNL